MGKRKRKRSAAEKAARKKRRERYETIFIKGKMKRVRRPPTIDGMSVEDFVRRNADPIFLHQEGLWEYLEAESDSYSQSPQVPAMASSDRQLVSFLTVENGKDLIVAFAIAPDPSDPSRIVSLILLRTPEYEFLLPPEERGISVSHELFPEEDRELARRIVIDGTRADIETRVRTYSLDLSKVDPEEIADAWKVLRRMHGYGGFDLDLR